jgi:hypothetical protein
MEGKIDLEISIINGRVPHVKRDLTNWMSENSLLNNLEYGVADKTMIDDVFHGLACMDIEMESAANLAREGDLNAVAHTLVGAMHTKDFIYGRLMDAYGGLQKTFDNINGNVGVWRDYVMEKFNGGRRQCAFILENKR